MDLLTRALWNGARPRAVLLALEAGRTHQPVAPRTLEHSTASERRVVLDHAQVRA